MADRIALIVANGAFDDQRLACLATPAHDAESLARVLADPTIGGFHVETLIDRPERTVRKAVERLYKNRAGDDLLLFYYSGHGLRDDHGDLFLATRDTEDDSFASTALDAAAVRRFLSKSNSRRKVVLLDCCFSGAFVDGVKAAGQSAGVREAFSGLEAESGYGLVILTASNAVEYAWQRGSDEQAAAGAAATSVFTRFLVQGLESGAADRDGDGWVALDELYDYVYEQVKAVSSQRPLKLPGREEGRILLARAPIRARLPQWIENALDSSELARLAAVSALEGLLHSQETAQSAAARAALERLRQADGSLVVRGAAAGALGAAPPMSPQPQPLVQRGAGAAAAPLLRGLESGDPAARAEAALALARLGRPEPDVLAALRARRGDADQSVRQAATAALLHLGRADELGMARVPAGEFRMGTSEEQRRYLKDKYGWDYDWIADEMPQRRVRLDEYYIDRTPVTNAAFAEFARASSYRTTAEQEGWGYVYTGGKWQEMKGADWAHPRGPGSRWEDIPDHPVVLVSWDDAAAYAAWAGKALPTEGQWEKAARGADGRLWPWGDEWDDARANTAGRLAGRSLLKFDDWNAWWNSFDVLQYGAPTTPVGSFPQGASPYGLLDCAGNVWQWTADWYKPYPGSTYQSKNFGETRRVLRGGAWFNHPIIARAAYPTYDQPLNRVIYIGFRCVVVSPVILFSF